MPRRAAILALFVATACSPTVGETREADNPTLAFWESMEALCGHAYRGRLTAAPEGPTWGAWEQIMHVHACDEDRILIRFIEDRLPFLMTRALIRREDGRLELRHDYRDPDNPSVRIAEHGGVTTNRGTEWAQIFPADELSVNTSPDDWNEPWKVVWMLEVLSGERLVYQSQRIGLALPFRFEFDLTQPVDPPPDWDERPEW